QQQRAICFGTQCGTLHRGMAAHGMSDPECVADLEMFGDSGEVGAECLPIVRRLRLAGATVSTRIDGDAAALRKLLDNAAPAPAMKSRRVREQQWRAFARPVPRCELFSVGVNNV